MFVVKADFYNNAIVLPAMLQGVDRLPTNWSPLIRGLGRRLGLHRFQLIRKTTGRKSCSKSDIIIISAR